MSSLGFKATATREGKWWVVTVEGVGVTQGRNAAEARSMAVDLVEAMLEADNPRVDIEFVVGAVPPAEIKHARALVERLADVQREAATVSRQVAAKLSAAGLTGADTAAVLGVSPQRVSQLLKDSSASSTPKKAASTSAAAASRSTSPEQPAAKRSRSQGGATTATYRRAGRNTETKIKKAAAVTVSKKTNVAKNRANKKFG